MTTDVERTVFEAVESIRDNAFKLADAGIAEHADIVRAMDLGCRIPSTLFEGGNKPAMHLSRAADETVFPVEAHNVLVLGNGTMAQGIAEMIARSGFKAHLAGRDATRVAAAQERVRVSCRRGIGEEADKDARMQRITSSTFSGLPVRQWDLVIEACSEDLNAKAAAWREVAEKVDVRALVATTTSSLRVADVASVFGSVWDVVGLHFFNPAPVNPLVEVIVGERKELRERSLGLTRSWNKAAVLCADSPGFIVNKLLIPYLNACLDGMHSTRDAREVDALVVHGFRFPVGPCKLVDLIGADTVFKIQEQLHRSSPEDIAPPSETLTSLVVSNYLGDKTGGGVLEYFKKKGKDDEEGAV